MLLNLHVMMHGILFRFKPLLVSTAIYEHYFNI